jgi:uncharacterized protein YegP (UPF0339 family)
MYFVVHRDAASRWRWRLQAGNHRPLVQSQTSFSQKQDCVSAIQAFRERARVAAIVEDTRIDLHVVGPD